MSELHTNEFKSRFPDGFRILQGHQEYITYLEHSSIRDELKKPVMQPVKTALKHDSLER